MKKLTNQELLSALKIEHINTKSPTEMAEYMNSLAEHEKPLGMLIYALTVNMVVDLAERVIDEIKTT